MALWCLSKKLALFFNYYYNIAQFYHQFYHHCVMIRTLYHFLYKLRTSYYKTNMVLKVHGLLLRGPQKVQRGINRLDHTQEQVDSTEIDNASKFSRFMSYHMIYYINRQMLPFPIMDSNNMVDHCVYIGRCPGPRY